MAVKSKCSSSVYAQPPTGDISLVCVCVAAMCCLGPDTAVPNSGASLNPEQDLAPAPSESSRRACGCSNLERETSPPHEEIARGLDDVAQPLRLSLRVTKLLAQIRDNVGQP